MTPEMEVLRDVQNQIAELAEVDQGKVQDVARQLRELIQRNGAAGLAALALVGAESAL